MITNIDSLFITQIEIINMIVHKDMSNLLKDDEYSKLLLQTIKIADLMWKSTLNTRNIYIDQIVQLIRDVIYKRHRFPVRKKEIKLFL